MNHTEIPSQSKYISGWECRLITANKQTRKQTNFFWGLSSEGNTKSSREQKLILGLERKHSQRELKGPKDYISRLVQTLM